METKTLPALRCLSAAKRPRPPVYRPWQSSSPWRKCAAQSSPAAPRCQSCCNSQDFNIQPQFVINSLSYKLKVSLNFGDQLLDLDLVACLRFLSARCGPIRFVSMNGRNMPCWITHLRSFAATTENAFIEFRYIYGSLRRKLFSCMWKICLCK